MGSMKVDIMVESLRGAAFNEWTCEDILLVRWANAISDGRNAFLPISFAAIFMPMPFLTLLRVCHNSSPNNNRMKHHVPEWKQN